MSLSIIILAAGKGKRMRTDLPKVLHVLAGMTLLERVVQTAQTLNPDNIYVVYGNGGQHLRDDMTHLNVEWVEQHEQLGTGHAVMQVLPQLKAQRVLILYGDVPLISKTTLENLLHTTSTSALGLVVAHLDDPTGFGRIIRNDTGNVVAIIEQKDANPAQQKIKEINTGIMTTSAGHLRTWLPRLRDNNVQHEYYLTDIIALAVADGLMVADILPHHEQEIRGVNTLAELANLERFYQLQYAHKLMAEGVRILDPHRIDVRGELSVARDVVIDVNVIFEGKVSVGCGATIGPNTYLRNVQIGEHVQIEANCVIHDAVIENHCTIGPFARIRPGTHIAQHARVGNFVEMKNTQLGEGSKVPHLSYVGDADIGRHVNMGAGTITVNYDGTHKHKTIIEDSAFIGCDTQLIAPVKVGEGAYIGAGSSITADAPAHKLTIARARQCTIQDWEVLPKKKEE